MGKSVFSKFFILILLLSFCFSYTPASYAVGWGSAANLSADGQNASDGRVAMDQDGNGISVWQRSDGSNQRIQASCYTKSTNSWSTPETLSAAGQSAYDPNVTMDSDGNGICSWGRSDGSNKRAQVSRYTKSTNSWSTTVTLSAAGQDVLNNVTRIAMDPDGNGICTWSRYDDRYRIQVSRYTKSTDSWSTPVTLSDAGQSASNPNIAMDPDGNGICAWTRYDGSNHLAQASHYTKLTDSWSTPVNLSDAGQDANYPTLDMDPDGNGICAWKRSDGSNDRIQASYYTKSTDSWSTPATLSDAGQTAGAYSRFVAMDSDGNGICTWWYTVTPTSWKIQASRYIKATNSWSTPWDLSDAGDLCSDPAVAMNPDGNGIVTWDFSDGSNYRAIVSRYIKATNSWSAPVTLSAAGQDAYANDVAMDVNGNGIAVWKRSNGSNTIVQASCYEALLAPTVYAEQILRNLATYTELINVMYWNPIPDAVEYNIYFNWLTTPPLKLTTIPASSSPSFEHHLVYPCLNYSYYIVANDNQGNTSLATKVSLP